MPKYVLRPVPVKQVPVRHKLWHVFKHVPRHVLEQVPLNRHHDPNGINLGLVPCPGVPPQDLPGVARAGEDTLVLSKGGRLEHKEVDYHLGVIHEAGEGRGARQGVHVLQG